MAEMKCLRPGLRKHKLMFIFLPATTIEKETTKYNYVPRYPNLSKKKIMRFFLCNPFVSQVFI